MLRFGLAGFVTLAVGLSLLFTAYSYAPLSEAPESTLDEPGTSSAIASSSIDPSEVTLVPISLHESAVEVVARPGDERIFAVQQSGQIVVVGDDPLVVVDISDRITFAGEQGLLGAAFHPTADLAYVHFTNTDGHSVVAEFAVDPTTAVFDSATFREVLMVEQPFENHNGGEIDFGPDGFLYIGLGDGGLAGDPNRLALDLSSRLGKILRVDPRRTSTDPFSVPADNPFVDNAEADPAVWSIGLRNPWKFSFDAITGDLWIADVGQDRVEEINRAVPQGDTGAGHAVSFGWSALEGNETFNTDQLATGHTDPYVTYPRTDGACSVSGGAVYRGDAIPELDGWYVFGDYCSGQIWGIDSTETEPQMIEFATTERPVAIAAAADGELYVVSNGGLISRIGYNR